MKPAKAQALIVAVQKNNNQIAPIHLIKPNVYGGIFLLKKRFLKNALLLTITGLFLRFIGVFFRVWLSRILGAEGMGLYQLVISVYVLASAFAAGGLTTAVTRQVADRLCVNDVKGAKRAVFVSVILTLFIAALTTLFIWIFSEQIALFALKDLRAKPALKTLCLGLPFMGIASCFKGYFLARRKAESPSVALVLEQIVRIGLIFIFLSNNQGFSLSRACAAVLLCDGISEGASCLYLCVGFFIDKRRLKGGGKPIKFMALIKENLHISLPITLGKYLSTFLRTVENLLVPQNLAKYTASYKQSLEQFGMIKGMALPILFFPASLLNSITTLLIPEVSQARAIGNHKTVKKAVIKSLKITLYSSFLLGGIFLFNAQKLGVIIYKSEEVGFLIRALAPLVPIMYLDSMADGLLKGLDLQKATLTHSFIDSILRIVLILAFVQFFGMLAFLCIMYLSNCLTCFLNLKKLLKCTSVRLQFKTTVALPLVFACISLVFSHLLLNVFCGLSPVFYLVIFTCISSLVYFLLLFCAKLVTKRLILESLR